MEVIRMDNYDELIEAMMAFNVKLDELAESGLAIAQIYEKMGEPAYAEHARSFSTTIKASKLVIPMR